MPDTELSPRVLCGIERHATVFIRDSLKLKFRDVVLGPRDFLGDLGDPSKSIKIFYQLAW